MSERKERTMSDDLVKRLRRAPNMTLPMGAMWTLCETAADRIEALEAENARFKEALEKIAAERFDPDDLMALEIAVRALNAAPGFKA